MTSVFVLPVLVLLAGATSAAPLMTLGNLMPPEVFPDAQFGMRVESVAEDSAALTVTTTGARVVLDTAEGTITLHQRIGTERPLAVFSLGGPISGCAVTHDGPGFARITMESPSATLRINGDSLCLVQMHDGGAVSVKRLIEPGWHNSWQGNHIVADELGAFALYTTDYTVENSFNPYGDTLAMYPLAKDGVLGIGVCPPRPYDWEKSLNQQVLWHWSADHGYPTDEELTSWATHGNMVLLQSEVLLWKDWNLDFVPRLGVAEFERVRNTIHGLGMPFIVYTSPYFFLKGTAQESQAENQTPGVCPGEVKDGENMPLFLDAIRRVMRDLKPDGLYFDGQYNENPAALYALARHSREIIGDEGLLEWHSTAALGPWNSRMFMPHADAYTDYQLRGEAAEYWYDDFEYLRFFVSGYNISNAIGVLCNNMSQDTPDTLLDALLSVNGRLHTRVENPVVRAQMQERYRPRITPALREAVDAGVLERQARIANTIAARRAFVEAKDWTRPVVWETTFDKEEDAARFVSDGNTLGVADGHLMIQGRAHTHAFLEFPLDAEVSGIEVRLIQDTDQGMSWGPGAALLLADDAYVRINARSDGRFQGVVWQSELLGGENDPTCWVWLRARWEDTRGMMEFSHDGVHYTPYATFPMRASAPTATAILVGKTSPVGKAEDNKDDAGLPGQCRIDWVKVYGK
jgi:hypothetical protein